jgi:hypothetical protein
MSFAGWINQRQQRVIEYLAEENRVLREQIGKRRMRFTVSFRQACVAEVAGIWTGDLRASSLVPALM